MAINLKLNFYDHQCLQKLCDLTLKWASQQQLMSKEKLFQLLSKLWDSLNFKIIVYPWLPKKPQPVKALFAFLMSFMAV